MKIGETIYNQLGNGTLYMLGAKDLTTHDKGVCFKIMRNAKGVSHIKIELNTKDLYDVTYFNYRKFEWKIKGQENDLYVDMLHKCIEKNTGLYTSL
jgi:hypothetical protein